MGSTPAVESLHSDKQFTLSHNARCAMRDALERFAEPCAMRSSGSLERFAMREPER
jgi:hypothetical protein